MPTFDLPLCTSSAVHCGNLRITYNGYGFIHADYYMNRSSLGDRLPGSLLQSTLFKPVMDQIQAAIENNRHTERIDSLNAQIQRLNDMVNMPGSHAESICKHIDILREELRTFLNNHSHLIIEPS